jgi:hypothetical protein
MNAPTEIRYFPLAQLQTVLNPIERDAVLSQEWVCVGFADALKQPSSVRQSNSWVCRCSSRAIGKACCKCSITFAAIAA